MASAAVRQGAPMATAPLQRRALLKGTAGLAGILATGMAPAVHAQEAIVLRYLGTAVNQDKAIADKFKADTGITVKPLAGGDAGRTSAGDAARAATR